MNWVLIEDVSLQIRRNIQDWTTVEGARTTGELGRCSSP